MPPSLSSRGAPAPARDLVGLAARVALSASFLSAVADRAGLWGPPGTAGVAWGTMARFERYTAVLAPYLTASLVTAAAWLVTALEVLVALALLAGVRTSAAAALSALLLATFAVSMTATLGVKPALDFSVWSAMAAAGLLRAHGPGRWSIDHLRQPAASSP